MVIFVAWSAGTDDDDEDDEDDDDAGENEVAELMVTFTCCGSCFTAATSSNIPTDKHSSLSAEVR